MAGCVAEVGTSRTETGKRGTGEREWKGRRRGRERQVERIIIFYSMK